MKGNIFSNKTWTLPDGTIVHLPRGITVGVHAKTDNFINVRLKIGSVIENGGGSTDRVVSEIIRLIGRLIVHVGNGTPPGSFHTHKTRPESGLPVGISQSYDPTNQKYYFIISHPHLDKETVWAKRMLIGTDDTYIANRESVLAKATTFRNESMRLYRDEFIKRCAASILSLDQLKSN